MDPELSRWLDNPRYFSWLDYAFWVFVIASILVADAIMRLVEAGWRRLREVVISRRRQ